MNPKIWDKQAHQVKRRYLRVTGIQWAITKAGAIWPVQPANSWFHLLTRETVTSPSIRKTFWLAVQMLLHCWAKVISFIHYGNYLIRRWFHQKEYSALCSSQSNHREIPGDELQSHLNSNKSCSFSHSAWELRLYASHIYQTEKGLAFFSYR